MILVREKETKNYVCLFDDRHDIIEAVQALEYSGIDINKVEYAEPESASLVMSYGPYNIKSQRSAVDIIPFTMLEFFDVPDLDVSECRDAQHQAHLESIRLKGDAF